MIRKLPFALAIFLFMSLNTRAQEVLTGLSENPVIIEALARQNAQGGNIRETVEEEALLLPFFDDFSQSWIFPAASRWSDDHAYVNTNFQYFSANRGVATLDAIDRRGLLHPEARTYPPFSADSLTSRNIRLDSIFSPVARALTPADSIYLSFFYQPQGRGNAPEAFDSLSLSFGYYTGEMIFAGYYDSIFVPLSDYILPGDTVRPGDTVFSPPTCDDGLYVICKEIYTYDDIIQVPCDSVMIPEYTWRTVWSSHGMKLEEFHDMYGSYSRQVLVPITDPEFFIRDFRFRFSNVASLAAEYSPSWRGNCDQWNIDYVYLDRNRSRKDTTHRDVGFVERAPSLLKNYESMPNRHYIKEPVSEMRDDISLTITNLDSITYNTSFFYAVYQVDGLFQYQYTGGSCNLDPFFQNGYQDCISCAAHACPETDYLFPLTPADSAEYESRYFIIGDITPVDTVSDTLRARQKFHNYFAYDDGTPEEGYGLNPVGAKLAYQFRLNITDTLRAVQMYFNHTVNNANQVYFDLMVWKDNNGKPGEVIYTQPMQRVEYSQSLNEFYTYMLDEPQLVSGVIYIGWTQLSNENLNIGYDRYNNAQDHIFYNTDGTWYQSTFQGSLLMRPMVGKAFNPSGTDGPGKPDMSFRIFPNPVSGESFNLIRNGAFGEFDPSAYSVRIISALGATVYEAPYSEHLSNVLPAPGLYILQVLDTSGRIVFTARIIKV